MSNLTRTSVSGTNIWTHTVEKAGSLIFETGGKYLDSNIKVTTPAGACKVSGTAKGVSYDTTGVSLSGSNTSGISIKGTGTIGISGSVTKAGWMATADTVSGGTDSTTTTTKYVTGVTLSSDSTKTFTVSDGTTTFTMKRDSSGNLYIY